MFNVNRGNYQFLYSAKWASPDNGNFLAVTPGAYELTEIAQLIEEKTNGNVIKEPDKK